MKTKTCRCNIYSIDDFGITIGVSNYYASTAVAHASATAAPMMELSTVGTRSTDPTCSLCETRSSMYRWHVARYCG